MNEKRLDKTEETRKKKMQKQINKGESMCRNKSVWWIVVEGGTD